MAKLITDDLVNLDNRTTAVDQINENFDAVRTALENTLSRDGTSPNAMEANLDMNSRRILNLPAPLSSTEPVRLADVTDDITVNVIDNSNVVTPFIVTLLDDTTATAALTTLELVNTATSGSKGIFTDIGSGADIFRWSGRAFFGAGADNDGSSLGTGGDTYIQDALVGYYYERGANLSSLSYSGGIGLLGASRTSDRYTWYYPTAEIWQASTAFSLNDICCYAGRIYRVTTAGTTGVSGPTHTTGTQANGTADLLFLDFSYMAPIGSSSVIVNDSINDAQGSWGRHVLAARMSSSAGTTYGDEMDIGNFGNDVTTQTPYAISPGGSTIGYWIAAGYDPSILSSVSPSTAAILIGQADNTFNKGIVFEADGITGSDGSTGAGVAIALAKGHLMQWYGPGGVTTGHILNTIDDFANRINVVLDDTTAGSTGSLSVARAGANIFVAEHGAGASATANYVRAISAAAGSGPEIRSGGSDTNIDLRLNTKGTGGVYLQTGNTSRVIVISTAMYPTTSDSITLGRTTNFWSDLFLASGGVIDWNNGDVTITHSANTLAFAGATSGYTFDDDIVVTNAQPLINLVDSDTGAVSRWSANSASGSSFFFADVNNVGAGSGVLGFGRGGTTVNVQLDSTAWRPATGQTVALGATAQGWNGLHLVTGGVINWANGEVLLTQSADALALTGGNLVATFTSASRFINNTDAASNQGLRIESDRATPAANDDMTIGLYLSDSVGTQTEFARITARATVVTDASEAGSLLFGVMNGGSLANELLLNATELRPNANDGLGLGVSGAAFSDLFLASGAVINFNAGNLTMTHSAGQLDVNGTIQMDALRVDQAASSIGTGAKTISNAADSSTNFGKYFSVNLNGTTVYIPCSTVAPT